MAGAWPTGPPGPRERSLACLARRGTRTPVIGIPRRSQATGLHIPQGRRSRKRVSETSGSQEASPTEVEGCQDDGEQTTEQDAGHDANALQAPALDRDSCGPL